MISSLVSLPVESAAMHRRAMIEIGGEDDVAVSFSIFYEKLFAELIVSFPEIAVIHL